MLVDNKFIYLSLPRCASTSFYITCLKNNLSIQHHDTNLISKWNIDLDLTLDNETIADKIVHSHERITDLQLKFGNGYDIISVRRRNRHERFISLWKHIIDLISQRFPENVTNIFKNMKIEDILFYTKDDLLSDKTKAEILDTFFKKNGLVEYSDWYMKTVIYILINPTSYWHNNDPNVIWFDFDKMNELEEWVSNKLGKPFKLEKSNGSQHFDCNIQLNDKFIDIYDSIYDFYDLPKQIKTLL